MTEKVPHEYLEQWQRELAGETGERPMGKQTLYRLVTELLDARAALSRSPAGAAGVTEDDWQLQAFAATVALAEKCGMHRYGDCGLDHIKDMMGRINAGFSRDRLDRWLGWAQCAVVASGCGPTLDDMKAMNRGYIDRSALSTPARVTEEAKRG